MKYFNNRYLTLPVLLGTLLISCTKETGQDDSPATKCGAIELGIAGEESGVLTRAVITDGTGKTMNNFDSNTKIFMVMQSDWDNTDRGTYNYGGSHNAKYTVTRGDVVSGDNKVAFDTKNKRYWDDAHARCSMLNIRAFAQKGSSTKTCTFNSVDYDTDASRGWTETAIVPSFSWKASNESDNSQTETTVLQQDVLFSNNLADNTTYSKPDSRLKFDFGTHKFPQEGNALMKFYHAMSKITIEIVKGSGFTSTSPFVFTTGNVKLTGFNDAGTFNITTGEFAPTRHDDIPQIYNKGFVTDRYTLEALVVPNGGSTDPFSRCVKDKNSLATDVVMTFTIDGNMYQITSGDLYKALVDGTDNPVTNAVKKTDNGTYIPLEAGKNYKFTFTAAKTAIKNITAQVAEWENVTAGTLEPSNARVTISVEDRGTALTSGVDFLKSIHTESSIPADPNTIAVYDWKTGYHANGKATASYADGKWSTNWFWESNLQFIHLRALTPDSQATFEDSSNGDYIKLASSNATSSGYDAKAWGAPFADVESTYKFSYDPSTKGFDGTGSGHQIYKAIGATNDQIKMVMFHLMSGLHITVNTTSDPDKVELYNTTGGHTKVDLVGYLPNGVVRLGNGLVLASGSASTLGSNTIACGTTTTGNYDSQVYYYNAIPQDLTSVKLYITTPDNNQYIVDLASIKLDSAPTTTNLANPYVADGSGKYPISRWYPGFVYHYTFTLKKTGIANLKATVVDWENVSSSDEVQIR